MRPGQLSRRQLLRLGLLSGFVPLPLLSASAAATRDRKFLFVFCPGGWDQLVVFCTRFNEGADRYSEAEASEAGGVPFVDSESRPSVRAFFEDWGDRAAIINGLKVPSVSHEICRRLMMTGSSLLGHDDWYSLLGSRATEDLPMPSVHIQGPIYPVSTLSSVVRVGNAGQLPALLDGSALTDWADRPHEAPAAAVAELEDAFLSARLSALTASTSGRYKGYVEGQAAARARILRIQDLAGALVVESGATLADQGAIVADCLEQGVSRAGMIAMEGVAAGWDTHASNLFQDVSFESLFEGLGQIMTDLASRSGHSGGSLLDETTVVVLSEMGRVPSLNIAGGKDHWTWTSAMIVGSGVAGGQAVGAYNEQIEGELIDIGSGEVSADGAYLTPAHLGATLLALADIDPGEYIDPSQGEPILAAMA